MLEPAASEAAESRTAGPLMTLAEAAAELGRPKEALRAMIRRGKLKAVRGNSGQYLVELPSDRGQLPGHPMRGRAAIREEAAAKATAAHDQAAAARAAELEEVVEEWRAAAEEVRLAAAVAAAERDAAKAAATAESAGLREMIAELRAQLADARRPWWRRLVGA